MLSTSKRKRSSSSKELTTLSEDSCKKKKMKIIKDRYLEGDNIEVDTTEEAEDHSKLLGLVTGQMKRLPLHGSDVEKEEKKVITPKKKRSGRKGEKKNDEDGQRKAGGSVDSKSASEYLMLWDTDRCNWSFKKKTQYWLLQNMYDKQKVCDYLSNLFVHLLVLFVCLHKVDYMFGYIDSLWY